MPFVPNPELGNRIITLMAALVLVLQIAAVGQRWIVSSKDSASITYMAGQPCMRGEKTALNLARRH